MIDWKRLIGCKIVGINQDADNCVHLDMIDEGNNPLTKGHHIQLSVDTEAIGHGLYTPVLYPTSGYNLDKIEYKEE